MDARLYDEHRCLRRLCQGQDVWKEFLGQFGKFIYCELAKHGFPDGPDRDDLIQEITVKLISNNFAVIRRHLAAKTDFSFKAVLRTVVYSVVCNEWSRRRRRGASSADIDAHPMAKAIFERRWADNPARQLYRDVRLNCLLQQVVGHSGNSRAFFILFHRYAEGLAVNEIAEQMEMSPNAVSQQLRYYRGKLKALIGTEIEND
jgi:RNA polymerase sigma factor (sigma-70 family)